MTTTNELLTNPVSFVLGKGISIDSLSATERAAILKNAVLFSDSQLKLISTSFNEQLRIWGSANNPVTTIKPASFVVGTGCIQVCELIPYKSGSETFFALTSKGEYLSWRLSYELGIITTCEIVYLDEAMLLNLLQQTPDLFLRLLKGILSALGTTLVAKEKELERLRAVHDRIRGIVGNLKP